MLLKRALTALAGVTISANALAIDDGFKAPDMAVKRQLEGLPYGVGVGSEGLSELVSNNNRRMDRARQLQGDIDNIQTTLIKQEHNFNISSIYYQDVYLRFAKQLDYETLDELVADVQSVIKDANLPGSDIFDDLNQKSDAIKSAIFASTAVALGGGVGHGILGYRQQIRRLPLNFRNLFRLDTVKNILNMHNWVSASRSAMNAVKQGTIDAAHALTFYHFQGFKVGPPTNVINTHYTFGEAGVTNVDDFVAAFKLGLVNGEVTKLPTAATAVEVSKFAKAVKYVFVGLEVAGSIAAIVGLILEVDQAHDVRRQLQSNIKDLDAIRFSVKRLEMQGDVWNTFHGQVGAAAESWLTLQNESDLGVGCYVNADEALETAFQNTFNKTITDMAAIDDIAVWNELYEMDRTSQSFDPWVHDDYNFDKLVQRAKDDLAKDEAEDNDDAELTQEEYEQAVEDAIRFQTGDPASGPPAASAATIRYLELDENKGAIWKLSGPFWTFQRGPGPDGSEDSTIRHRFQETNRTDTTVNMRLLHTNKGQTVVNSTLTIDLASNTVVFSNETLPLDPEFNAILVPTTGWNTMLARVNTTDDPFFTDAYECNSVTGWTLEDKNGNFNQGLFEFFRDKASLELSARSPFDTTFKIDPKANISFEHELFSYSWVSLGVPLSTFDLIPEASLPRLTIG